MLGSKSVLVVGTGTIGEPLIGLLADNKEHFGIDEVTFHKRTPLVTEKAKVSDLVRRGAVLCVDDDRKATFEELGHAPKYEKVEAIERATVVIDCTPVGSQTSISTPRGQWASWLKAPSMGSARCMPGGSTTRP